MLHVKIDPAEPLALNKRLLIKPDKQAGATSRGKALVVVRDDLR